LAIAALTDRLTPPPGAPETRGQNVLILEEGPALLTAAALKSGAGRVFLVCLEDATVESAQAIAERLGLSDRLELVLSPLGALVTERARLWNETFSLAVASASPYALARRLKNLYHWLIPKESRLVCAGMAAGTQASLILKSAFKAGYLLHSSATADGYCVVNLARRPASSVPVWDWSPGAWLSELTEDELSILDEAEAQERRQGEPQALRPPALDAIPEMEA
jgi:hypothetical protein